MMDEAMKVFTEQLGKTPKDAVLWSDLGNAHRVKGHAKKAIQCFEMAIKLEPLADFYLNLGGVHYILGEFLEALRIFDMGLEINDKHVLLHFSRGNVLSVLNDVEAALESFETAVKMQPDFRAPEQYIRRLRGELKWRREKSKLAVAATCFVAVLVLSQRAMSWFLTHPGKEAAAVPPKHMVKCSDEQPAVACATSEAASGLASAAKTRKPKKMVTPEAEKKASRAELARDPAVKGHQRAHGARRRGGEGRVVNAGAVRDGG